MLETLLTIPWEVTPNLILSVVALVGAFATLFKLYQSYNKRKVEEIKQIGFNLEKVEKIDVFSQQIKKDVEEIKTILTSVKNKQEVDYDYIIRIFDTLEKHFENYRNLIIAQLNQNSK